MSVVHFSDSQTTTHPIPAIPLEHHKDVYYSRQELIQQRQEVMDPLQAPQKKKTKKKKNKKKQQWKLEQIRAINERRACFRKWVYIRNRCYVVGAIGYAFYYWYNYEPVDVNELKQVNAIVHEITKNITKVGGT